MDLATAQAMVFETLQQATSQNSDILKPAEQKLKEWETVPGFYTILFVSICYFKNLIFLSISFAVLYLTFN